MIVLRHTLVVLAGFALCTPGRAGEPFRFPEARRGAAELKYIGKVPVLVVSGTPEEMGEGVGTLAVKPGVRVLDYPQGLLKHFSAEFIWKSAVTTGNKMVAQFPADHRKEMDALVKASGADRDKIVAGNTLFDIKKMLLCSALLVESDRSATGGPLLGRNLDYPSLGWIHEYSLVTVYRPKGKHSFVSVGFPGLVGCLSGMNDSGLALGVLEVFGARDGEGRFDPKGIPYGLCFRSLLEDCTTIDEAKKKLEQMPRTTLLNLVVADRNGVGVLEITPKSVVLRRGDKGTCSCTNHFCTEVKPTTPVDMARSFARFDLLEGVRAAKEKQTVEDVRKKLDAVNLGDFTLQTMVFEPAALKLHLGLGDAPASRHKLVEIDLAPLLKPTK